MGAKEINERRQRQDKAAREAKDASRWFSWWNIPSDRFAFFVALFTLFLAILAGIQSCLMGGQLTALQTQVDEMKAQRLMTQEQMRANLRRENPKFIEITDGGKIADKGDRLRGWDLTPVWTNIGTTIAKDYIGWFKIFPFDHRPEKPIGGEDCPPLPRPIEASNEDAPTIVQPQKPLMQRAQRIDIEDGIRARDGSGYILVVGHIEYRDEFPGTPLHFEDWCLAVVPNDISRNIWSPFIMYERAR